ncbi:MAG: hypothetical protein K6E54_05380 [Bacteroidaceae bacterium]|nr:hypothetical protein [Bacteroidaceae bacterium]
MTKNKIMGYVEILGETVVTLAAALWITKQEWVPYVFAAGTIIFAVGRLAVQQQMKEDSITLKRLYRQRAFAVFVLLACAALMFAKNGFYFGYNVYITNSSWLLLFIVFVIIEVYTAFRIPSELKKS